ncbi:MAG: FGGY-family carbohydrate kinase, partial [Gammaproteobacteria bacterium]|nr:FGGY-family carbohydrate kinase [Gammaproteobacteria bacterium]
MSQVLGIDFGTSGARACVLDQQGQSLANVAVPLPAPLPVAEGGWEQDPELWWTAFCALLDALGAHIDLSALQALAIAGTSGTLVVCNDDGRPLHPALMYHDARAKGEAVRIAAVAPRESGAHGASASLAKLLWLRARGLPATARVLHQAEWLAARLLGRFDLGDENNLLKLGYDVLERRWPDWLDALGIDRARLPLAHAPGTPQGRIDAGIAGVLGLSPELVIVAGTTDSIAATLASGAARVGDAVTTLGTTLALKVFSDRPVFAPQYGVYSHRLGDLWLAGGASNSGGAVLRQYFDDAALEVLSARIDPRQDSGLDYYPLPGPGERFPIAAPDLTPRLAPRPEDDVRFLHGLLEGMARIERDGYHRLCELGAPWPA